MADDKIDRKIYYENRWTLDEYDDDILTEKYDSLMDAVRTAEYIISHIPTVYSRFLGCFRCEQLNQVNLADYDIMVK